MNRRRYTEEEYIEKCKQSCRRCESNVYGRYHCNINIGSGSFKHSNYSPIRNFKKCQNYLPIKKSALRGEPTLMGMCPENIHIPSELLPYHKEYISKRDSGYCDTHNCKLCSLNEHCRVNCYEDITIDLDSCELSNLASIHSMLESICNKRFNDCKICPLSRTGEKSDCYVHKFLNSNIQALDEIYNDISE